MRATALGNWRRRDGALPRAHSQTKASAAVWLALFTEGPGKGAIWIAAGAV